jgi:hypothetical protein
MVVKTRAFCLKVEKELVTETSCQYYKRWTFDFVKVAKYKVCFYVEKQVQFRSMSNLQTCFYTFSLP